MPVTPEGRKSELSVNLSDEDNKSGGQHSPKSESEYSEFVHENEVKEEPDAGLDTSIYEPCPCERCNPRQTHVARLIGWLDAKVLKKFLVYHYTPENVIAQNEVQEFLENDGVEEDSGTNGQASDLNAFLSNAISNRESALAA